MKPVTVSIAADKILKRYKAKTEKLVVAAAQETRNVAVNSIQRGAKSGKTYKKYNPRRTHTASAAGQAPASDTGRLASSINLDEKTSMNIEVGTDLQYAAPLEFGTKHMSPRPFLSPAADKGREKLRRLMKRLKA